MKLRLFESYHKSEVDFLGQIFSGMLPVNQDQITFESFLKKVVFNTDMKLNKGFTFIPVNEQLQEVIINKAVDHFPGWKIEIYNTLQSPDYAAIHHYKFDKRDIPYFDVYLTLPNYKSITFHICKGPFIFVTTYFTTYQPKENCWRGFQIPAGGERGLNLWDAWGFFDLDGFDQIFSEVSRKVNSI
jgi:hypothetical protein